MYEYTVIFTNGGSKYAVLIKQADNQTEAIKKAIEYVSKDNRQFNVVEAVYCE